MRINRGTLAKELRLRDLTQKAFAEKSGVTRATINNILGGKSCSDETGQKIAAALEMKLEDLL